jgi:hypothetical protein
VCKFIVLAIIVETEQVENDLGMISLPISKQEDPRCKKNVFSERCYEVFIIEFLRKNA